MFQSCFNLAIIADMKRYIPAISSFFLVGAGQILKGNSKKGLLLFLAFYFALPMSLYVLLIAASGEIFLFSLGAGVIAMVGLWLYSFIDAVRS